jgi:peptidoglycan/xylan/chitin deacetylase (PgdA/CDA1 family)
MGKPERLDRWLTLKVAAPVARLWPQGDDHAIPILMYHSVSKQLDAVHPYLRTVTTPASFERQMDLLSLLGYAPVRLSEAVRLLQGGTPDDATARPVVLSFDDGLRDFHAHALPVLQRAGFPATMFVSTGFIGKPFLNGRDCLDTGELRELCQHGIEIGSHSVSHGQLVDMPPARLREELWASRRTLEDITGHPVDLFSYPYRYPEENRTFTRHLADLLDECGYRAAVTTVIGRSRPGRDVRALPRLPVNDSDDAPLLGAKLSGHYDWLRAAQRLVKRSRALLRRRRTS